MAAPPGPARCAVTADLLKVAWPGAMSFIEKKSADNPELFMKFKTQLKGLKEVASLAEAPGRKPCRPARRARGRVGQLLSSGAAARAWRVVLAAARVR